MKIVQMSSCRARFLLTWGGRILAVVGPVAATIQLFFKQIMRQLVSQPEISIRSYSLFDRSPQNDANFPYLGLLMI
jgi:hypothetical protein